MRRVSHHWDCVTDATVLRDFAALRRERPHDWHRVMRSAARRVGLRATVAQALRCGGQGALLPEHPGDANRLKALRRAARLLVDWYGAVPLGAISEAWLRRQRRRMAVEAEVSRDQVSRCFTLLRRVALRAARHDGVAARVRPRLQPCRRATLSPPPERPMPAGWHVEALMADTKDPRVRCAVALQAHVGARPGRVLALRVRDIDLREGVVRVAIPGPDERLVQERYALPPAALAAVLPWLGRRRRAGGQDALLFPIRGDASRPTTSLSKAIRRETDRIGLPPLTLQAIRRLAQAVLRGLRGTRAQVRGSRRVRPTGPRGWEQRLTAQARRWREGRARRLPLRAPRACGADEPELQPRRRRTASRLATPPMWGAPLPARASPRRSAWKTSWSAMDQELEDPMTAAGERLPMPAGPLPSLAPGAGAAPVSHQTLVVHQGYSRGQMDSAVQLAYSGGVATAALLAWATGDTG